jgi:Na+/proline symporter
MFDFKSYPLNNVTVWYYNYVDTWFLSGYSLSVIVGMNFVWAVVISEAVSIVYTFTGGLNSVAYTDIVELLCLFLALVSEVAETCTTFNNVSELQTLT